MNARICYKAGQFLLAVPHNSPNILEVMDYLELGRWSVEEAIQSFLGRETLGYPEGNVVNNFLPEPYGLTALYAVDENDGEFEVTGVSSKYSTLVVALKDTGELFWRVKGWLLTPEGVNQSLHRDEYGWIHTYFDNSVEEALDRVSIRTFDQPATIGDFMRKYSDATPSESSSSKQ